MSTSNFPNPAGPATIEFNCTSCGRTLKVAATAAGKRASCPQCNTIVQVPLVAQPTPAPQPALGPQPMPYGGGFGGNPAPAPWGQPPQPQFAPQPQYAAAPQPQFAPQPMAQPQQPAFRPQPPPPIPPTPQLRPQVSPGHETPTKQLFDRITAEIAKIYVGQDELVLGTLVALFSSGHVLIESVPGLGKTLFVRTLGRVLGCKFGRIQFTADLMPSDITGAPIFDMKTQEFRFRPGPVFTQFLLADEINRSPGQDARRPARDHAGVSRDGRRHEPRHRAAVPGAGHAEPDRVGRHVQPARGPARPLHVQDRGRLSAASEEADDPQAAQPAGRHRPAAGRRAADDHLAGGDSARRSAAMPQVRVDDRLVDYINKIVRRTREWPQFHMGASPRAGIALMQGARTLAAFRGRDYAVPDDVVQIALPALRHRVILTAEAEVEGHKVDDLLTRADPLGGVPRL